MKLKKEKNIEVYNADVVQTGKYIYTDFRHVSAKIATERQTEEIVETILTKIGKNKRILDVGCGDGTFTLELLKKVSPKKIVGIDYAKFAIQAAKNKVIKKGIKNIQFLQCNIYNIDKRVKKGDFDVVIIRGVLHHLYEPKVAINSIAKIVDKIIVLECNGYNPILKLIEKISPYHREHEEKSYFPPSLNKWFKDNGFQVNKQEYCVIVPYFCNKYLAKLLYKIQPFFESIKIVSKLYCGSILFYYEKTRKTN